MYLQTILTPRRALTALLLAGLALPLTSCGKKQAARAEEDVDISEARDTFTEIPAESATVNVAPTSVLVRVNGKEITRAEVDQELQNFMARAGNVPPAQMAQLQQRLVPQIIDSLVVQHLLQSAVIREQIAVEKDEIDAMIAEIQASIPEGMTLEERLETQGMTLEELRKDMALNLRIEKLLEKHGETDREITEEEVQSFYEENPEQFQMPERVTASHILVMVDEDAGEEAEAEARKKAEDIREQLVEGADFAVLAKEHSDCGSSQRGGDLGTFTRGQMDKAFEEAAFSQDVGELGEVVKSRFGYHIIKVSDHESAEKADLEEMSERIRSYLSKRDQQRNVEAYVQGLKEKADIEYPGRTDAPAAE